MSGLAIVNRVSSAEHRSRMIASFFTAAYLGGIVPIVGLGFLSDRIGLQLSVTWICGVLALLTAVLATIANRSVHASLRHG